MDKPSETLPGSGAPTPPSGPSGSTPQAGPGAGSQTPPSGSGPVPPPFTGKAPTPKQSSVESNAILLALIGAIPPLADKFIQLKLMEFQHEITLQESYFKASIAILVTFVAFLGVIIALMSYLAIHGTVSGDSLLFLTGTVAGFVFSVIYRQIFRTSPPSSGDASVF